MLVQRYDIEYYNFVFSLIAKVRHSHNYAELKSHAFFSFAEASEGIVP